MERDPTGTRDSFQSIQRELVEPIVSVHGGRVVKTMGDAFLIEFASVVEAVRATVTFQRQMLERETQRPKDERLQFRIGVNLGEIIVEGEDIHGEGVNVAARLEALAEPDGIVISGRVHEQMHDEVDVEYQSMGEQRVKNVARSVRAYKILLDPADASVAPAWKQTLPYRTIAAVVIVGLVLMVAGGLWWWQAGPDFEPANPTNFAYALPEKPSIAVLPFDNLSKNPNQEVIVDGLTENIITTLAQVPRLFIIARNSVFTYKNEPLTTPKIAEALGVRYVLLGSVQQSAQTIRISVQLVDALSGQHIWAKRYDRELTDLFRLQDEIAFNILTALEVALTEGERARISRTRTDNLEAYIYYLRAAQHYRRFTPEDNEMARELAEKAVALDPNFVDGLLFVGWAHQIGARFGWTASRQDSYKQAAEVAQHALKLDDSNPGVYSLLGAVHRSQRRFDDAITAGRKAVALAPSVADYYANLAVTTYYAGEFAETVELTRKAMRLHPHFPNWYLYRIGVAYRMLGEYDEAVTALKTFYDRRRKQNLASVTALAATYGMMGREKQAAEMVAEALELQPEASLKEVAKMHYFKNPAHLNRILDALRKAGLRE
jgi:adenylate cyclase